MPLIQLKPVVDVSDALLGEVRRLYESSFPFDERRDWTDFVRIMQVEKRFHCQVVMRQAEDDAAAAFCGFLNYWDFSSRYVYIEHFAMRPLLRNQGLGGEALRQMQRQHSRPLVLEAELPTDDLTRRRVAFYERHGLRLLRSDYIQPPFRERGNTVPLCILGTADSFTDEDVRRLHQVVYGTTAYAPQSVS
ncbi:MAG: GNAT family N-acetyltransferase [Paludibacteraceae bacterium]|nr:GNAT family N-acetyltransferase [Paludibacteraceae bacterium]